MPNRFPSPRLLAAREGLDRVGWQASCPPGGEPSITVQVGGSSRRLDVLHDDSPAPAADVAFIAAAREDVDLVADWVASGSPVAKPQYDAIRARYAKATPGQWVCLLESDGGLGGSNVITLANVEQDLYLLVDGRPAPDPVWEFVALAHEELPFLLDAVVVEDGREPV